MCCLTSIHRGYPRTRIPQQASASSVPPSIRGRGRETEMPACRLEAHIRGGLSQTIHISMHASMQNSSVSTACALCRPTNAGAPCKHISSTTWILTQATSHKICPRLSTAVARHMPNFKFLSTKPMKSDTLGAAHVSPRFLVLKKDGEEKKTRKAPEQISTCRTLKRHIAPHIGLTCPTANSAAWPVSVARIGR
ncbi:unnamed protein product [Ectocarpus sp. 12 AP-2014]